MIRLGPCADPTDRPVPESASLAEVAHVSLICPPDEARRRLKRIEELGFDEVLLVSHAGVLDEIERARDFL
jgi:hypothetical protein